MMLRLFVYGTLAPDRPNEHILQKIQGTWQNATVKGILHDKGWGAKMGYPAISISNEGTEVPGHLFSSDELKTYWPVLDEFEGRDYERIVTLATIENKKTVNTHIYVLKESIM